MKRIPLLFVFGILCAASLTILQSGETWAKVFEPGNIIDDSIFTNSKSMNTSQIQTFLNAKGAHCVNGEAPCLKNFSENGKSASQIIYDVSQQFSINPQVLIVVLQKEVGLVTLNQPGSWRYRTAMGYGCPDSTPGVCDASYYGFTNQMTWAARMYRAIMNASPTWYTPYVVGNNYVQYHPNGSCGGTTVNIQNRATQALYNYTPYQPNKASLGAGYGTGDSCSSYGNRNFWLYFNDWFGNTNGSVLIQSPASPAVYLQSGDTRFGIPSWDTLEAYGLSNLGVTPVSDSYMSSLIDGGTLSTVFTKKNEGAVYLADNGYRFGFATYQQCVDWGFAQCLNSSHTKALEPAIFDRLRPYGALSPTMLNGSYVYLMKNGQKQAFLTAQSRTENGYGTVPYTPMTNRLNTSQQQGNSIPQNNSLVSFKGNGTIYAYANGTFYPLSYEAFRSLNSANTQLSYDDFSHYTKQPPVSGTLIQPYLTFSNGKSYALTANTVIDITAAKQAWPTTQTINDLQPLVASTQITATATLNSTYRTLSGGIFKIEAGKAREFYSLHDYFELGNNNPISVSDGLLADLQKGTPLLSGGYGSVFQTNEVGKSAFIYTTSSSGTVCRVYSLTQIGLYGLRTENVRRINMPTENANILSTTTYDQNGDLHLTYEGVHSIISAQDLKSTWGIQSPLNICQLNTSLLSKNRVNRESPKFVRNEHTGIIYIGDSGYKRPIYSYDAFLRLGGNSTNTHDVSMEFLVASPDGTPIYK